MKKIRVLVSIILVLILAAYNGPLSAFAAWAQQSTMSNPNGSANQFGWTIDLDADYAIVGAPFDSYYSQPQYSGSAWIYKRSGTTWSYTTGTNDCDDNSGDNECLKESTPTAGYRFGKAVAISGNFAAVSAPTLQFTQGHVYIYKNNGSDVWSLVETINSPETDNDGWAQNISMDGDYLAISHSHYNSGQGSIEIYKRNTNTDWPLLATITASDGSAGDDFDHPDLDGDNLIVGASSKNSYAGGVYIYNKTSGGGADWDNGSTDEVANFDGASADDDLGFSVSINGNYAAAGADGYDNGTYQGAAYVYYNNVGTWGEQQLVTASDGLADDGFGSSIAISGDRLLVGASGYSNGDYTGAAYYYTRSGTTWGTEQKVEDSGGASFDSFGTRVAMDGSYSLVGNFPFPAQNGEVFVNYFTSGGGAVPEFSDYVLFLVIVLALAIVIRTVPKLNLGGGKPA